MASITFCFLALFAVFATTSGNSIESVASVDKQCKNHDYAGFCRKSFNLNGDSEEEEFIDNKVLCDRPLICARIGRFIEGIEILKPLNGTKCDENRYCQNEVCMPGPVPVQEDLLPDDMYECHVNGLSSQ